MWRLLILMACLQDPVETAVKRYETIERSAKVDYDDRTKAALEVLVRDLRATAKSAAAKGDLATAQKAMDKLREFGAEIEPTPKGALKPGLMCVEYPKIAAAKGWGPITDLKGPIREYVVKNFAGFRVDKDKNYLTTGFLKITVAGEYTFRLHTTYGRSQLFISGKELFKHGDDGKSVKVKLLPGHFPLTFVTWQDNRDGHTFEWQVPGTPELVPVPDDVFFFKEGK